MIARKSFLMVISQFFTRFLGWIGLVMLAKLWGDFAPEALGIIGFAMAFLALFNFIADLGFGQAHVKRISEGKDLGSCIGTYATIKILITGLMVATVLSAIFIWKYVLNEGFYDATTESVLFIILFYYIIFDLQLIAINTFRARREIAKREITCSFEGIVKIILVILVVLAGVNMVGISPVVEWPSFLQPLQQFIANHAVGSLAATYVFGIAASFLVGMWFLRKYPLKRPNWELFKSYFSFAFPIMLFSSISLISFNIDKIMIGYFWTSIEVGYYFTMQQLVLILMILHIAVGTVLFPTLSEYHSNKNFEKINQTTQLAERYVSMIMIPPIVVIIVFVYPVINIMLNDSFLPAASVLVILSVYTFLFGLRMPYGSLISGINRPGVAAKIAAVICVTNIVLNYLFIPKSGLLSSFGISGPNGAAIATVLSCLVGFFGMRIAAKRLTGIKILQSHTPRHIIAGLVMGGMLYYVSKLFVPYVHWYHLLGFAGLGLAIYLGVLFVLKEFKRQDLNFFLDMLHPKEMLKYIKSELKEN